VGQTWSGRAETAPAVAGWKITVVKQLAARQRWAIMVLVQPTCVEAMFVCLVEGAEKHGRLCSVPTALSTMQRREGLQVIHESFAQQEPTECASGLEEGAMHVWEGYFVPLGRSETELG
jgi:hypothetical protein